ncbi:ATPase family protein associated with various cellular activities (AAA) [Nitrosospira multiformis]|uniref:ATPase family protein associated with various cellular activities (AAA) n=1 Tax=Nitrosospira multiformis TaxID=1231 RepID=A0A2T5I3T4_9PROT|nr:ATP-binding protein [Nitrosospira multiformis]PTQ78428.1 ATPase family protein associated with various cellular activities (AAA) [Nitrosospira multiformis]
MKADLTKRLFRAIALGLDKDVNRLCRKIIEDEGNKGHVVLANQLESILKTKKPTSGNEVPRTDSERVLQSLPLSRRYQDPLVVKMTRATLRHFMVLPESVEVRFRRIEQEYAARERLASFGLRHKKKILLYGHPGCGKTLGAERLAWATGLPLVKVRFDALISSYFGESGINLRAVFESAKTSPCLLFLDECDFIAKSRSNQNDVGEVPRLVNTLLQLLDDFDAPGLLVAATNLDKQLDKALFRRFDDVFEVLPPGAEEIERLLKTTLSAIKVASNIRWEKLSSKLVGMSSAEVVKVAQDAAKSTILSGRGEVQNDDLMFAISEIYKREQN